MLNIKLKIKRSAFDFIQKETLSHVETEVGGSLIGAVKESKNGLIFIIEFCTGSSECKSKQASYLQLSDKATRVTSEYMEKNNSSFIGIWHKHPGMFKKPSSGDLHTIEELCKKGNYPGLILIITNIDNDLKALTSCYYYQTGSGLSDIDTFEILNEDNIRESGLKSNLTKKSDKVIKFKHYESHFTNFTQFIMNLKKYIDITKYSSNLLKLIFSDYIVINRLKIDELKFHINEKKGKIFWSGQFDKDSYKFILIYPNREDLCLELLIKPKDPLITYVLKNLELDYKNLRLFAAHVILELIFILKHQNEYINITNIPSLVSVPITAQTTLGNIKNNRGNKKDMDIVDGGNEGGNKTHPCKN